jgi:hypothetical protein
MEQWSRAPRALPDLGRVEVSTLHAIVPPWGRSRHNALPHA